MRVEPLHPSDRDKAIWLYREAFPAYERCALDDLLEYEKRDDVEWLGIYDDGFIGMAYTLFDDHILFILYFAIAPECRNRGLGAEALRLIRERRPDLKPFLNIESTESDAEDRDVRVRRKMFYERNGFTKFGDLRMPEGDFENMGYGEIPTDDEMSTFRERIDFGRLFKNVGETQPQRL